MKKSHFAPRKGSRSKRQLIKKELSRRKNFPIHLLPSVMSSFCAFFKLSGTTVDVIGSYKMFTQNVPSLKLCRFEMQITDPRSLKSA